MQALGFKGRWRRLDIGLKPYLLPGTVGLRPTKEVRQARYSSSLEARLLPGRESESFSWFQTVKSGRVGNGRGDNAKTGWLLSLLLYRFSEILKILCTWNNIFSWCIQEFKLAIAYWHSFANCVLLNFDLDIIRNVGGGLYLLGPNSLTTQFKTI